MHRVLCLFRIFIFGCVLLQCDAYESPEEFTIHVIDALTPDTIPQDPTTSDFLFAAYNCGFQMALDMFKNNTCNFPPLLPNTKLTLDNRADFNVSPNTIKHVIDIAERGSSLIIGLPNGETAGSAAVTGEVYDIAILSAFSPSSFLDDAEEYPYFTRVPSGTRREVETLLDSLLYYFDRSGPGWTDIAIITSIDGIGIDFSNQLVLQAPEKGIQVFGYQQFLPSAQSYFIELRELSNSGARVIVASVLGDFSALLEQANEFGIVGDHYVWAVASHTGAVSFSPPYDLYRGILTTRQYYLPDSVYAECFTNSRAAAADQYICGAPEFEFLNTGPFENILTTIYALDSLDQRELLDKRVSAKSWSETIRNLSFDGLTGHVSFDKNGQRQGVVELSYFNPETESFVVALLGYPNGSIEELEKVVWFSNTTEIPDLDIRPPFSYWSCEDGEERRDETGKTVNLHSPDGEDVDEIESAYHCDLFIDCKNLSDESKDCPTNYTTLFIIFGIITGLLMCVAVFLILFVIIFGVGLKYQKVKKRSPNFLIILLVSIFIGYSSVFAFYGKPHPVACAFQPWLLGLPAISMIAVLTVKNFRVYRIFRFPLKRIKVSDVEVFVLWVCVMVPAVIIVIIWSIVSTPTARLEERDGNDHYVCTTGGFTDTPGGIIFFCIFVAYSAVVLLIGAVISFLARNIPSSFNETKLLTISIYNLGFLAAVIIPVLLVVQPFNPFIAWILRTVAVLYAFTATMLLQFSSMLFNIVIVDRMKNKTNTVVFGSSTSLTPGG